MTPAYLPQQHGPSFGASDIYDQVFQYHIVRRVKNQFTCFANFDRSPCSIPSLTVRVGGSM